MYQRSLTWLGRVLSKEKGSRVNPKIEGSIFGAKPRMRGLRRGRAREGGVPPVGGGFGRPPARKF